MASGGATSAPTVFGGKSKIMAVIGDEDTVTGFLLGGIGELHAKTRKPNFLIVDKNTKASDIDDTFKSFLNRDDIGIILISQYIAEMIRGTVEGHDKNVPAVLEIPSKEHPYDPSKDSILRRARIFILKMSLDTLLIPAVNWSLFLLTSLVICLRTYAPLICIWILNQFYSPSMTIDALTNELKNVTCELKTISPQDEFAAYSRKERQRNSLVERLKTERNNIETKQKTLLTYIRTILNIGTVFIMIFLTIQTRRTDRTFLFYFPFFRFPLVIWIMALNTFVNTVTKIYLRYLTNKKSTEK
ncbi:unnamed protein product [Rotaria socialis]|uniref:Guided entry of tail-anchored proteins factor 1 n=2 Tax=Rotaria socialis TaxID=392032 RepID=A0A820QYN5_9BILA|nr:unnamed protein product [Rotaria socialis]